MRVSSHPVLRTLTQQENPRLVAHCVDMPPKRGSKRKPIRVDSGDESSEAVVQKKAKQEEVPTEDEQIELAERRLDAAKE